jgi:hypothetical protein
MKRAPFILALGFLVFCGCAEKEPYRPGWHVYRNEKYQYEIQYPEGYDLWETGPEGERDGATIRIAPKDFAAPIPALGVHVYPQISVQERLEELSALEQSDIVTSVGDVEVNGLSGKQIAYRWQSNGELLMVELFLGDVYFRYEASAGTEDLQGTPWWEIISTFRFLDE